MDEDNFSAGSLIGTCVVDLNTLLMQSKNESSQSIVMSGWLPIFDTIEGIRGELNVKIALTFDNDMNVCFDFVILLMFRVWKNRLLVFLCPLVVSLNEMDMY